MAVMARRSMKAKQVLKSKKLLKASETPKAAKTKSLKTVMKSVNTKSKVKEFFRVVDFLHLGLGLKLGHCYTRTHMQKLCAGDRSKLKQLARYMEDPTRLQLEWLTPHNSEKNVTVLKSTGGKVCSKNTGAAGKKASKPAPKLSEVNRRVSKKPAIGKHVPRGKVGSSKLASKLLQKTKCATQQERGPMKAKSILTRVSQSQLFAKARAARSTDASTGQFTKTLAKTWKTKALDVQAGTKRNRAKAEDEDMMTERRRNQLIKLPLEDLQVLHKSNDLRTEPVKDFASRVKARFIGKKLATLQGMCTRRKLATSGNKSTLANRLLDIEKNMLKKKMVEALLIFEKDARNQERVQNAAARAERIRQREKVYSATSKLRKQIEAKSHIALTAHLRDYGLKVSGTKSEKVERVVARMRKDGEAVKIVASRASKARKRSLRSMHPALLMLECAKTEEVLKDDHFRKMIIERLVSTEEERAASQK